MLPRCAGAGSVCPRGQHRPTIFLPFPIPSRESPMLYFIQAGDRIKIGRGDVPSRLKQAKTFCPDKPSLILAINVPNEVAAETAMKRHFRAYCTNGEWFRINFRTAFAALLQLNLIPDHDQPILELPSEEGVMPEMPAEFERWFVATRNREYWSDADIEEALKHLDYWWNDQWRCYEQSHRRNQGNLDAMIEADRPLSPEEYTSFIQDLKKLVQSRQNQSTS